MFSRNSGVDYNNDMHRMIDRIKPDIMTFQETHLRTNLHRIKWAALENFTLFHSSLPAKKTNTGQNIKLPEHQKHDKAGVSIAIHNKWQPNTRAKRIDNPKELEGYFVATKITSLTGKLIII